MSGGLKMLSGSDMSPSKDNLIISSLEDVHITSDEVNMDISVEINTPTKSSGAGDNNKENHNNSHHNHSHQQRHHHHRNSSSKSSSNKDKMGNGGNRDQSSGLPRSPPVGNDEHTQQKNLINNGSLRQSKDHHHHGHQRTKSAMMKPQQFNPFLVTQPPSLKGTGRDEKYHMEKGDDPTSLIGSIENHNAMHEGPMVVEVDPAVDEVLGRRGCCETERCRLDRILRKKQEERTDEFTRMQSRFRLEGDNKLILNLGWEELVQALQKRELTATSVLEAYTAKALDSTLKYNNITDFIPQATQWAKELDSLPEPKGPLHGVPFCVKDDTNVEGLDTTLGFAKRLYQPASESAVIVRTLMDLGAVPFCKTNVPQTLFTYGSDNPVFGCTVNATNPKLSPGGSSSGTGSLVGASGCMFGTGTDIGGSLRIPAHFNGVASIKPTVGRLSPKGVECSLSNLVGLETTPGIIGKTPSVCATVFKGLSDDFRQHKYDPKIAPIPWDNALFQSKEKLRIGYFTNLPYFPLLGDTEEVVLRAKSSLESLGHTLVPFTMPDQYNYMRVIGRFLLADHARTFSKCWKGERIAKSMALAYLGSWIPVSLQKFIGSLMNCRLFPFLYSKRTSVFFGAGACTSHDLWDAQGEKNRIIQEVLGEWKRLNLNAVICPLFPFPAPPVNLPGLLPTAIVYAMIWNLVDFPAGMVPFGRESGKNIDSYNDEGDNALKMAKKGIKESIGAPIGVQVVSLPYKEEIVLRVMCELEQFSYKH